MSRTYSFLTRPLVGAAACAALFASSGAQADILHYNTNVNWTDTATVSVTGLKAASSVYLTNFTMYDSIGASSTTSVQNQNTSYWKAFTSFCYDIAQPVNASLYGWSATNNGSGGQYGTTGITNGTAFTAASFTAGASNTQSVTYNSSTVNETLVYNANVQRLFNLYYNSAVLTNPNADTIAGFQVAIWALEFGNYNASNNTYSGTPTLSGVSSTGFTYGSFSIASASSAAAITNAQTYLNGVLGNATASYNYALTWWQNTINQDQISVALVPEPATDLLAALGLAGLIATRRRRKV